LSTLVWAFLHFCRRSALNRCCRLSFLKELAPSKEEKLPLVQIEEEPKGASSKEEGHGEHRKGKSKPRK
jgi:hypothetical protein